jgi:hypothetical protein
MFHGNGKERLTPSAGTGLARLRRETLPGAMAGFFPVRCDRTLGMLGIQPQVGRNADRTLTVLFAEKPRKHGQQDVNDD